MKSKAIVALTVLTFQKNKNKFNHLILLKR